MGKDVGGVMAHYVSCYGHSTSVFWSTEDGMWVAVDDTRPGCAALGSSKDLAHHELIHAQIAWDRAQRRAGNLAG
jgi:hypothetical protein